LSTFEYRQGLLLVSYESDNLNVLSSGGIKDLNYDSEGHGKCPQSQRAPVPQSKNNITKDKKKQLALIKSSFYVVTPELIVDPPIFCLSTKPTLSGNIFIARHCGRHMHLKARKYLK
jgi:hypothetical protein